MNSRRARNRAVVTTSQLSSSKAFMPGLIWRYKISAAMVYRRGPFLSASPGNFNGFGAQIDFQHFARVAFCIRP